MLKPLIKLKKDKAYVVKRIGDSTPKVTQGKIYIVKYVIGYQDNWDWIIADTDHKGVKTQPVLRVDSDIWQVLRSVDGEHIVNSAYCPRQTWIALPTQPEEKTMSDQKTKLRSASTGRMINSIAAKGIIDAEIIRFIKEEREKMDTLGDEIGTEGKYYKAQKKTSDGYMKVLVAELESRA